MSRKLPLLNNLIDYKNIIKDKNRRCFVLGNGRSLNDTNLDLLENDYSFALNKIGLIYENTSWRPSVYCSFSSRYGNKEWKKNIIKSANVPGTIVFVTNGKIKEIDDIIDNKVFKLKCTGDMDCDPNNDKQWSFDIEKKVTKNGTTLMSVVQIALYMGFKKIYLLGCDLGYSGKNDHFDPNYLPNLGTSYNKKITNSHKLMLKKSKEIGAEIYNATIGGELEVYERVNYKNLFENK